MMMQNYAAHTKTVSIYHLKYSSALYSTGSTYTELPRKLKKSERKPWVTSVNELKSKARLLKKDKQLARERILRPPENGLLVKELIPVAHQVYAARAKLYSCVSRIVKSINIYSCSMTQKPKGVQIIYRLQPNFNTPESSSKVCASDEVNTNQQLLCALNTNCNQLEVADSEDNLIREEAAPEFDDSCSSSCQKNSYL